MIGIDDKMIEAIPVCVPLKPGMTAKTAYGDPATSPFLIVRMHIDQGVIVLGEATVNALWSGETQADQGTQFIDSGTDRFINELRPH